VVYEAATFSPDPLVELSAYHHMISMAESSREPESGHSSVNLRGESRTWKCAILSPS